MSKWFKNKDKLFSGYMKVWMIFVCIVLITAIIVGAILIGTACTMSVLYNKYKFHNVKRSDMDMPNWMIFTFLIAVFFGLGILILGIASVAIAYGELDI